LQFSTIEKEDFSIMWRPRDRERYIGGYDPEHEMPDPDRGPGGRWQSDAYRHNARDSRFAYRMNPDFVERHYDGPRGGYGPPPWDRGYDRGDYDRGSFDRGGYDRGGYGGGYGGHRGDYAAGGGYNGGGYDRGPYDRGGYYGGPDRDWDRGPFGGSDRSGWDRGAGSRMTGPHHDRYSSDRGMDHDRWAADRFRDREYGADDWNEDWRRRR
jgi:hypothetical protein